MTTDVSLATFVQYFSVRGERLGEVGIPDPVKAKSNRDCYGNLPIEIEISTSIYLSIRHPTSRPFRYKPITGSGILTDGRVLIV